MKFLKFFLIVAGITGLFFSCSKTDIITGASKGTLKVSDTTGDCLPSTVGGTYTAGVALNSDLNYIDVWINVTAIGSFSIATDSVNGMSFASSPLERLGITGLNRIRLYGKGKPLTPGLTTFNVTYDGSQCTISFIVGSLPSGSYLFSDTVTLAQPIVSGVYTAGIPLSLSDSVVVQVNVTKAGSIYLASNSVDGITFSGTGVFTSTGIGNVTLTGTGIPEKAGTFNFYLIDSLSDTIKFSINVVPFGNGSPASFTLGGAPGSCSGFIISGNYTSGIKLQAADSISASVTVTKAGAYSIVTAPSNGVVFSSTGIFDSAGVYAVTLKGSGIPIASGTFPFSVTGDSSTCQFSINFTQGNAVYTLGGTPGACSGFSLTGNYITGTALTANNTVTMQVNVVTAGAYSITTVPYDGMTFSSTGNFTTLGTQTVVLTGTGNPVTAGTINFTVPSSTGNCIFTIDIISSAAEFALGITPYGQCTGFTLNGQYVAGKAVTAANTAIATVTVVSPGTYSLYTDTVDGIIFTANGSFTTTGTQKVTLYASGTPTATGSFNYFYINGADNVNGGGANCSFTVTVVATGTTGGGTAAYTLGATSGACSSTVNGTYTAGTALTAANSIVEQVNVTAVGSYTITTSSSNGISFSGSGTFVTTGAQSVTLQCSGTPSAAGTFSYTANAGASTCSFSVTTVAGAAPGTFSLGGSGCSGFQTGGVFTAGTSLTSLNTATTQVNVTAIGSYSITTATINGISFSGAGNFTSTGMQTVILTGTGTPTNAGSFNYTATGGNSTCTFSVTTVPAAVNTGTISCTIGGTAMTFNVNVSASNSTTATPAGFSAIGNGNNTNLPQISFGIMFNNSSIATAGTYVNTVAAVESASGYTISFLYIDPSATDWEPNSAFSSAFGGPAPDPLTIVITSITATQAIGTFSGTIRSTSNSASTLTVTNGTFNVPIQ